MVSKDSVIALFNYLKHHGLCSIYYEAHTGAPYLGYQNILSDLLICDGDVTYHAEKEDVILIDNRHGLERLAIIDIEAAKQLTVHRYQTPRKLLPFNLCVASVLDVDNVKSIPHGSSEYNWALYEYYWQLATSFSIGIIEDMALSTSTLEEIAKDLSTADTIHPATKISRVLGTGASQFKRLLEAEIEGHLAHQKYKDINGNVLGNSQKDNTQLIGPVAICVDPNDEEATIAECCTIIGRNINLVCLSKWFPFLNKKLSKALLKSEFGLSMVTGALKQAGIFGHDTFITNETEIIEILRSEMDNIYDATV